MSTGSVILCTLLLGVASTVDVSSGYLNGQVSSHSLPILRDLFSSLSVLTYLISPASLPTSRETGSFGTFLLHVTCSFIYLFVRERENEPERGTEGERES